MGKRAPLRFKKHLTKNQKLKAKHKSKKTYSLSKTAVDLGWDKSLSVTQNYARFGLSETTNLEESYWKTAILAVPDEKLLDLPEPGEDAGSVFNARRVSYQEQYYLKDLIAKYGDDFKKMSMDIKLNRYQHTPRELEKKIQRMHAWHKEEKEMAEKKAIEDLMEKEPKKPGKRVKSAPKKRIYKKIL
jgi:hypothetical protein